MKIEEYNELSERTLSTKFHTEDKEVQDNLIDTVQNVIQISDSLDHLKKVIFYGKEKNFTTGKNEDEFKSFSCEDEKLQKVLHAAIGMVTESVEILDQVFNSIKNNEEMDVVNIEEELGDSDWYKAIFLREYGFNEGDLRHKNIDKLAARYGEKFDGHKALNQDLDKERDILEK